VTRRAGHSRVCAGGFVLPSVLAFILVFSIIGLIGTQAAREGQSLTRDLQARHAAERALVSAESRAVFALLTGEPVIGGLDLSRGASQGEQEADGANRLGGLGASPEGQAFWSGKGGKRRDSSGVTVAYQDAAGLVSLNRRRPEQVEALLEGMGLAGDRAQRLAATLIDYVDDDDRRRFLGAERQAYRLAQRPPPTNAPLRDLREAYRVLDWREEDALWRERALLRYTTTQQRGYPVRREMAPPELARMMPSEEDEAGSGQFARMSPEPRGPSGRARLILTVDLAGATREKGAARRRLERAIAVARTPQAADRPYRRYFLWERTQQSQDDDAPESIPPLLPPQP